MLETIPDIVRSVSRQTGVAESAIMGRSKYRNVAYARQRVMYEVFIRIPRLSIAETGRRMGGFDHTSVRFAIIEHGKRIGVSYDEAKAIREERRPPPMDQHEGPHPRFWTVEQKRALRSMYEGNTRICDIAAALEKTETSIRHMVKSMGLKRIRPANTGKPQPDVPVSDGQTERDIRKADAKFVSLLAVAYLRREFPASHYPANWSPPSYLLAFLPEQVAA